jgi:glycosyltransferase involved in cell wall biosynthesis
MIHIHALTVCVGYADLLGKSIDRWRSGTAELVIVTTPADIDTQRLASAHNAKLWLTDIFTARGATFNKGAAISQAVDQLGTLDRAAELDDWFLFFDADIVPPPDWLPQVRMADPQPGRLHGAPRHREDGRLIPDPQIAGYFHLFHARDKNAGIRPIVDVHWSHAGNYDSTFQNRWQRKDRIRMNVPLVHMGEVGANWCGRGNADAMRKLHDERCRRGGWRHEVIGQ